MNNLALRYASLAMLGAVSVASASADEFVLPSTRGAKSVRSNSLTLSQRKLTPDRAAEESAIPQLNGIVIYADHWGTKAAPGLYALPRFEGAPFDMLVKDAYGPGVVVGDRLYTIARISMPELDLDYPRYSIYDMVTGEELLFKNYQWNIDWSICPVDMDVDPVSGDVYAITFNSNMTGYQLSKLTLTDTDVVSTKIIPLQGNWNSMAFDSHGTLYAISKNYVKEGNNYVCESSSLNTIDMESGEISMVGTTGLCPEYSSSAAFDRSTDRLFWTVSPADNTGLLAEVNTATGAATVLRTFANSEEIVGLYAPQSDVSDSAPGKATDLAATFENGSLSGHVSFTAPAHLVDGSVAKGNMTYTVLANSNKVAEGNTTAGAQVSAEVTVAESGRYEIEVIMSNSAGEGPKAKVILFIGKGIPQSPFVNAGYEAGTMQVSWYPVSESIDGGYIDPAAVTYTVRRYPDNVVVANNITTCTYSESIPTPDAFISYQYGVTAVYEDKSSEEGLSRPIGIGDIVPPFSETFDDESAMSGWTILNSNGDTRMWMWSTMQNLRIGSTVMHDMDDWVITPALRLEAYNVYRLRFVTFGDDPNYPERMEVKMGQTPTAEGMTETLVTPFAITSTINEPNVVTCDITPSASGTYYIGFHGMSGTDGFMLNLDDISVAKAVNQNAPAAAELTVTPNPDGEYSADIKIVTPTKSLAGSDLYMTFSAVRVYRDGEFIKNFSYTDPGDVLNFTDQLSEAGEHTYRVVCVDKYAGEGMPAEATVFIGTDIPAATTAVNIEETANEGEVTLSWNPVTTDYKGNPVNPTKVTYVIAQPVGQQWQPLFEDIAETSCTFRAVDGEQDLVQYAVFAKTESGVGEGVASTIIPVGPAFNGLKESFPNGRPSSLWVLETIRNATWNTYTDSSGVWSQDNDNGFLGMTGNNIGDEAAISTGKISLADINEPVLDFYTFNYSSTNDNIINVEAKEISTDRYLPVKTIKVSDYPITEDWNYVRVPLDEFDGKTIQLRFRCSLYNTDFPMVLIDNINVNSAFSGIAEAVSTTSAMVTTLPGIISISGADKLNVKVFRIDGIMIHNGTGDATLTVAPGLYIVTAGSNATRILVR